MITDTGRYFKHPPKYQILHCLRNRVHGGASLFVDAFHAAAALPRAHSAILAATPVPFHYINGKYSDALFPNLHA